MCTCGYCICCSYGLNFSCSCSCRFILFAMENIGVENYLFIVVVVEEVVALKVVVVEVIYIMLYLT